MTSSLDQAFLIDVSEEDDSLLPSGDKSRPTIPDDMRHCSSVPSSPNIVPGHMGCTAEAVETIQEDPPFCQPVCREDPLNLALPVLAEEPALAKKKKKIGFNVRKSLAWNNAFFTEEGVLDSEELSLVNRTFQQPRLPKASTLKIPSPTSKLLKPPMMPKISISSHKMALTADSKENLIIPAVCSPRSSTGSSTGSVSKLSEQHSNNIKGLYGIRHVATTPISLANVHMDTSKREKSMIPAHVDPESKSLLRRRSIEKKDQGRSLPGVNHCNEESCLPVVDAGAAVTSDSVTSKAVTHFSRRSSLMKSSRERFSSAPSPRAQPVPSSTRFLSETASSKTHATTKKTLPLEGSGTLANRDKPSGLRMPSPTLGFFDTGKPTSQVAVLRERTNGHGYCGPGPASSSMADKLGAEINSSRSTANPTNQIHGLKHTAASAKSGHQPLEAPKHQNRGIRSSTSIPVTPHVHRHSAEVASLQAPSVQELPRSAVYVSNKKIDSREQVLQARKLGQNTSTWGKPVQNQPANFPARNVQGQENLSPDCKDGKHVLQKCMVAQGLALGQPNTEASGETCAFDIMKMGEEHAKNALSSAQNSVSASHSLQGQQYVEESIEELAVSRSLDSADTERAHISQTREASYHC